MRLTTICSVLAVACGVIATPIDGSANGPTQLLQEAMPVPTLFPQLQFAPRDDNDKGKDVHFGWINTEKAQGNLMTEKEKDPVSNIPGGI
jgi:hypothetical protein